VDTSTTALSSDFRQLFLSDPPDRGVGSDLRHRRYLRYRNQYTELPFRLLSLSENLYITNGVSINDPAFGGIGVWYMYGPLGTGINLSFVRKFRLGRRV
jgi:hypothetical protein